MSDKLDAKLAAIAAEAEAGEEDQTDWPIPPHVKVSHPNRARSKVLQIRLNPEELNELERVAESRGLPTSTVGREAILRYLFPDTARSAAHYIGARWVEFEHYIGKLGEAEGQVFEVAVAAVEAVFEAGRARGEAEGVAAVVDPGCD